MIAHGYIENMLVVREGIFMFFTADQHQNDTYDFQSLRCNAYLNSATVFN